MRLFVTLFAALLLALPGQALGQGRNVPPGNSEIDQYVEAVPDGGGSTTVGRGNKGRGTLTPAQRSELEALGPDGVIAADLANSNAARGDRPARSGAETSGNPRVNLPVGEAKGDVFEALGRAITGDTGGQGMGLMLPLILLATLLAGLVVAARSRRRVS